MTVDDMGCPWHLSPNRLEIGQRLFQFLVSDSRHLQRALDEANQQGEQLQLHLWACKQAMDWPFELLAQKETFLIPYHVHLVRQVSDWGKNKKINPQKRTLKLLFMACSALDIKPELHFEKEEETIFRVTEELPVDIDVEDSGSLAGLRAKLV